MAKNRSRINEAMLDELRITMARAMDAVAPETGSKAECEAQDLYYEAMETGDMDLIYDALDLDPANVDCLRQFLCLFAPDDPKALPFARQLVEIAGKRLGKQVFEECKGAFWGFLETRPYMRARAELAQRLVATGQLAEAITEHKGMLELCPNDNLGIRYGLLSLYLQENRAEDADRLLKEYSGEIQYSAVFAWGAVLERFLAGRLDEAANALKIAREQNGFVEAYLKGHRKLPKKSAGYYSPGSREEAQMCAELQKAAWDAHPESIKWLEDSK